MSEKATMTLILTTVSKAGFIHHTREIRVRYMAVNTTQAPSSSMTQAITCSIVVIRWKKAELTGRYRHKSSMREKKTKRDRR